MAKKHSRCPCSLTNYLPIIRQEPHQLTKYYHRVLTPSPFPLALAPQPLPSTFHDSFSLRCLKDKVRTGRPAFYTANVARVTLRLLANNDNNCVCIHVWLSLDAEMFTT